MSFCSPTDFKMLFYITFFSSISAVVASVVDCPPVDLGWGIYNGNISAENAKVSKILYNCLLPMGIDSFPSSALKHK